MATIPMPEFAQDPLLATNQAVLELIATGEPLTRALTLLCQRVEQISPGVVSSILLVRDGHLHTLAGPSLSQTYCQAIDGAPIGPAMGSCGTAAYTGEPVEVQDISSDLRWADYKHLAAREGLRACWSSPIKSRHGHVIGTFAFYYRETRGPSELDRLLVDRCVHLCSIAIENDLARNDMHRLAYYDPVTRLMNRGAFQRRLTDAISESEKTGDPIAVHLIDLDDFKQVNDTLGHPVGDQLLAAIANRLMAVVRHDGEVARIGGDEFAILATGNAREAGGDLAWRLLGIFATPFVVDDHHIHVDASIGISIAPEDGSSLPDIMRNADLALYRAKADGKGRYRFFVPMLAEAARTRLGLAQDLKRAVDNEEFTLAFQPIVDLRTRRTAGCEALLRWNHPVRGPVPPASFLPLAEEIGLINPIGDWVLREACRQAATWPTAVTVSVNISPVQLRAPGLTANIKRALSWSGLPPERLKLEITESAVLSDDNATFETLLAIKEMGVGIALDDFGTGYSSLRSLRIVPLDCLKIDQSFVVELGQAPASTSIIRAVIALARSLGIDTTAEGVETSERAWQLLAEGCDFGQGHFFGRPMDAAAIEAYLRCEAEGAAVARATSGA